jgi:hypothetical protein
MVEWTQVTRRLAAVPEPLRLAATAVPRTAEGG